MTKRARVAFLDRDGTLVMEPEDKQVDRLEKVQLVPGVIPALLRLRDAGFRLVMVSNQDGLGTDSFPTADFQPVHDYILALFRGQGLSFDQVFVCPHREEDACECRKPRVGLVAEFMDQVERDTSVMIGDRDTDLQFARNLGIKGFLLNPDDDTSWPSIVENLIEAPRTGEIRRATRETTIDVAVDLDRSGQTVVATGIGFFDHMLEQISKHGGFSLQLSCDGDLDVDDHHTVEDVALALGAALKEALGDKKGIGRYGFTLPMDEALATATLDLSGRSWLEFQGRFPTEKVGAMATEMVPHFFRSLADALGATLHLSVKGDNSHHMVEACFKVTGRALKQALARQGDELPSTKGVL